MRSSQTERISVPDLAGAGAQSQRDSQELTDIAWSAPLAFERLFGPQSVAQTGCFTTR